jgi:CBS domain-containing protein
MNTEVVTLHTSATVEEAIRTLLHHKISGTPVVDDDDDVVGVVTEYQFLEAVYDPEVKQHRVGDLMTKDLLAVHEETHLPDIANLFVMHRVRRIPVIDNGKVIGVISRRDLLRQVVHAEESRDEFSDDVNVAVES